MRRLLPAVLFLVACSGETTVSTTSPVAEPTTTTTTLEAEEPVDICPRGVVWEPGTTYSADCFLVPVTFEAGDAGWRSSGARARAAVMTNIDSGSGHAIRVGLLAYRPDLEAESVLDSVLSIEGVVALTDRVHVVVAGHDALTVDAETASKADDQSGFPCVEDSFAVALGQPGRGVASAGYTLVDAGMSGRFGMGACRTFRIWVFEAAGSVVTVVATPDDPDRFDDAIAVVERLLDSMTFEAP